MEGIIVDMSSDVRKSTDQLKRAKQKRRLQMSQEARRRRGIYNSFDVVSFAIFALILLVSVFLMSTASVNANPDHPYFYFWRHIQMILIGLAAFVFVMIFDYRRYKDWVDMAYIAVCVVLVITKLLGTGDGANRWILGFQPSEAAKVAMIVLFAAFLDKNRKQLKDPRFILRCMVYMGVPAFLIFIEPDLGTSLVFFVVMMAMLYVAGANRRVLGATVAVVVSLIAIIFTVLYISTDGFDKALPDGYSFLVLQRYQLMRLAIFINPDMDALGSGYHIIQSKIAIGSGGLFGKGYLQGTQIQGRFLPEHQTDFIFSVLGEEFGFFITAAVLVLLMVFLLRLMNKAFFARDFYGTLIVVGIVTMMLFQVFENVGMAMGIMPVTGLPLPFFSYGGTSMLINMAAVGLVFSVALRGRKA